MMIRTIVFFVMTVAVSVLLSACVEEIDTSMISTIVNETEDTTTNENLNSVSEIRFRRIGVDNNGCIMYVQTADRNATRSAIYFQSLDGTFGISHPGEDCIRE